MVTLDYAILRSGNKQYRVKAGDLIDVDLLQAEEGASIELTDILAVSRRGEVAVGTPVLANASVLAEVRDQHKDKKVLVFKYKRKTRYRRKKGHRQWYTRLSISAIFLDGEDISLQDALEAEEELGGEAVAAVEAEEQIAVVEGEVAVEEPAGDAGVEVETEQEVAVLEEAPQASVAEEPADEAAASAGVEEEADAEEADQGQAVPEDKVEDVDAETGEGEEDTRTGGGS